MWKPIGALLVIAAGICGSILLYQNRGWLLRPDISRTGGTRLTLRIQGDGKAIAQALRKRLDPLTSGAVAVTVTHEGVWVDVPAGPRHDELVDQALRLAARPGRLWLGVLAAEDSDPEAVRDAQDWLRNPAHAGKLTRCQDSLQPPPPPRPGYAWAVVSDDRASRQGTVHGVAPSKGWGGKATLPLPAPSRLSFFSHRFTAPGRGGDWHFVLARELPRHHQIGPDGVESARLAGPGPSSGQLIVRLTSETASLRAALQREMPPTSRIMLLLDDEVLLWHETSTSSEYAYFLPTFETGAQAEEARALILSPFPEGAKAEVVGIRSFPAR
jgi:hypothetical protein